MKIRNGFVSNSSSSSFVVSLSVLNESERQKILNYENHCDGGIGNLRDYWNIRIDEERGVIRGSTIIDNGDLSEYLGEELGSKCIFNSE